MTIGDGAIPWNTRGRATASCILLALAGCAPLAEPDLPARLEAIVRAPVDEGTIVGLSAAVTRGGKIVYSGAHGLADRSAGVPMSASTPLRLASVSKMMTAALALHLEAAGRVSLDTPIADLVPEAAGWLHPGATLHHGLSHTAGLPDYVVADIERYLTTRAPLTDGFVLAQGAARPAHFGPGEQWAYSNTGFYLAALALRRATGLDWDALIRDFVAAPLALGSLRPCDEYIGEGRLRGYQTGDGEAAEAELYQVTGLKGDGGLCATAEDVAAFARRLEGGAYLPPGAFERMVAPTVLAGGARVDYGLGARLGSLAGHRVWGHTGSFIDAYVTTVLRFPDDDVTVVVLLNTIDAPTDALVLAWRLAEVALDLPPADLRPVPGAFDPAPLVGEYVNWGEQLEPLRTRVSVSGAGLEISREGASRSAVPLIPLGPDSFGRADWPRDRFRFHLVDGVAAGYSEYYAGLFAAYHVRLR